MEKRIFGRRYNTDTAKLVAFNESESLGLNYYFESVYRKRNGEYFFYAAGNAATVYADCEYGVYTSGYVLIPLRKRDVDIVIKLVEGTDLDGYYNWFDWKDYCHEVYPDVDVNAFYV
jgi:hypothetical protein